MTSEFLEPFEQMLGEVFAPSAVRAIEAGEGSAAAMQTVEQSGFLDALVAESEGGAGLSLADVAPLWMALGRHAVPVGIGEAMIERATGDNEAARRENATALLHAALIAGAAGKLLDMAVAYANERVQFGKLIGKQQALQQNLAVMAQDVVAVRLAVELAASKGWPETAQAAVAKSVAAEAAPRIANTAHAVFGAIGISAEHDLNLYTRALHRWRLAGGAETLWSRRLGEEVLASSQTAVDWTRSLWA
ncbi:acyl-CoA dehydrogenase family protein [Qipengyuania sp. DSG2-2]|uniref:acyl-CoA dehydrogenase family protein n=1 Tax=Qipengyuania sp. DGS2-2 TaxID=3349631 RepID=UPI0036D3B2D1